MAIIYTKTLIAKKITLLFKERGTILLFLVVRTCNNYYACTVADKLVLEERINQLYDEAKENCELVSALISTNKDLRITTLESKQLLDSEKGKIICT